VFVRQITATGFVEDVRTYNAPVIPDAVVRGDVAIIKVYDPTPGDDTGEMAPEEGITFDFYGSHQFMGSKPNAGARPAFSITTDAKGHADTTALYVIENADGSYSERPRKETDTGGIPYGTYLMVQRSAPAGFEKVAPVLVSVLEDGRTVSVKS
jgi:hypothetical protein